MPTGSAVEAETTIERIQSREGVVGLVICGEPKKNELGETHFEVHRKGQSMQKETAQVYADRFGSLANLARGVVRDIDPQVSFDQRNKQEENLFLTMAIERAALPAHTGKNAGSTVRPKVHRGHGSKIPHHNLTGHSALFMISCLHSNQFHYMFHGAALAPALSWRASLICTLN